MLFTSRVKDQLFGHKLEICLKSDLKNLFWSEILSSFHSILISNKLGQSLCFCN